MFKIITTILFSLLTVSSYAEVIIQSGHNNSGYQFYSEEITPPKLHKPKQKAKPDPYPYTAKMDKIKKEQVETQDRYLINPSQENTIKLQRSIMAVYTMGERAAMAKIQMLSTHPELSYRAFKPNRIQCQNDCKSNKIR